MDFMYYLLIFVAGFGAGYWVSHRGVAGITSDLEDARREASRLRDKIKS